MKFDLQYQFKNPKLLEISLTHRSYLNEHKDRSLQSNERLEFLGDAVLELIVSLYLFQKYPQDEEGQLTLWRSRLVQTKTLALAGSRLNVGSFLKLSKGEKESKGNENPSLLADTFEAVIGAIFTDGGFDEAYNFVLKNLILPSKIFFADQLPQDYKSKFQEVVQAKGFPSPVYKLLTTFGPDHKKIFETAVYVANKKYGSGNGASKQEAEQKAAKAALQLFEKNINLR